jgi:membrane associated rhomboid family serine protease
MDRKLTSKTKQTSIWSSISGILSFVLIIWAIEIFNYIFGHPFSNLGIYPRELWGLPGILFTPLIHHGFEHTITNSISIIVLGILISLKNHRIILKVSLFIIIVGGLGVWIFGRPASHIGASGLIFGYFGFLVARGWYVQDFGSIAISIVTIILYGGMIFGIFPGQSYISWEAHLFGFLAGLISARIFR